MPRKAKSAVTVIAGPARSGKTSRVVDLFLEARAGGGGAVLVVPDAAAARSMRLRLLARLRAVSADAVSTFVALCERILADAASPSALISAHERELLLRAIVRDLTASGRLRAFAAVADFDGFYLQLAAFIRELKSCQIEPQDFRKAKFGPKTRRDTGLADVYELYQRTLEKAGLYDSEGRFWKARVVLQDRPAAERIYDCVFLDGFTDFTASELSLLRALAAHAGNITVTLPYDPGRESLFAKTAETLNSLRRDFSVRLIQLPPPSDESASSRIAAFFAQSDGIPAPVPSAGRVRLMSAAGVRMEMEEIAREAKRLILAGRKPGDIAVVSRNPSIYREVSREAFDAVGVPLDAPAPLAFGKSRLYALLSYVVALAERDFQRETVIGVLASPYVDLGLLAGAELSACDVVALAREAGIVKGMRQWRARLAGLERALAKSRGESVDDEDDKRVAVTPDVLPRIDALRNALDRLEKLVSPLSAPASARAHARSFGGIIDALGVRKHILDGALPEDVLFRDLAGFSALTQAMGALGASAHSGVPLTAWAFLRVLARAADADAFSGEIASGGVAFLDVITARNLSFPVVFVCGALADAFPSPLPVGPFYSRLERARLAELGLVTRTEELHLAAERLVFYQAATRARETLYVSWPGTDEAGKPKLASFYLDDLKALFEFSEPDVVDHGPSRIVRPLNDAWSPAEVSIAAGAVAAGAESPEDVAALAALAAAAGRPLDVALRSAAIEARRESLEDFDHFDAVLGTEAAASAAGRFPPGHPWSGTALTQYKECPFLFFLTRVLRADCPEEPDVVPTPLERGSMAHDFLAALFTRLRDSRLMAAVIDGNDRELAGAFESVFDAVADGRQTGLGLSGDAFWEIERARMREMLRKFVLDEVARLRASKDKCTPAFFELSFGLSGRGPTDAVSDASSAAAPVEVRLAGRAETLCGRIDRVDFVESPKPAPPGRSVFIIDYKLSRKPGAADVASFADMQMPVYLFAAPDVVPAAGGVTPAGALYRTIRDSAGKKAVISFEDTDKYERFRGDFAAALFECVDRIRGGFFAPRPAGECQRGCPGAGVCRFSSHRVQFLSRDHDQT